MSENIVDVKRLILPVMVGRNFTDKMALKLDHEFLDLSRYSEKKGKGRSLLSKENRRYRYSVMSLWVSGKFSGT